MTSPFTRPRVVDDPPVRLVVFHHAGGSAAAYYPLVKHLPQDWEVLLLDLPGRGKRNDMAPLDAMDALIDLAVRDVLPWRGVPLALFGHSMGAVLAVEVARALESCGEKPLWVGASGRVAPALHLAARRGVHELSDAALLFELTAMGGIPDRIGEVPQFRRRFLDLVRTDLRALDSYRPAPDRLPLEAPLTAFGSVHDDWAPPATVAAWAGETVGEFRRLSSLGGHFHFLGPTLGAFAGSLAEEVNRARQVAGDGRDVAEPATA